MGSYFLQGLLDHFQNGFDLDTIASWQKEYAR